jgi:hypothetical protein
LHPTELKTYEKDFKGLAKAIGAEEEDLLKKGVTWEAKAKAIGTTILSTLEFAVNFADLVFAFIPDPFSNEDVYKLNVDIYNLDVDIYNLNVQINQTVTAIYEQTTALLVSYPQSLNVVIPIYILNFAHLMNTYMSHRTKSKSSRTHWPTSRPNSTSSSRRSRRTYKCSHQQIERNLGCCACFTEHIFFPAERNATWLT